MKKAMMKNISRLQYYISILLLMPMVSIAQVDVSVDVLDSINIVNFKFYNKPIDKSELRINEVGSKHTIKIKELTGKYTYTQSELLNGKVYEYFYSHEKSGNNKVNSKKGKKKGENKGQVYSGSFLTYDILADSTLIDISKIKYFYKTNSRFISPTSISIKDSIIGLIGENRGDYSTKFQIRNNKGDIEKAFVLDFDKDNSKYAINLFDLISKPKLDTIYYLNKIDENSTYILPFVLAKRDSLELNEPELIVSPLNLNCNESTKSTLEVMGKVMGGTVPYYYTWYILQSENPKDILYAPYTSRVENTGDISTIKFEAQLPCYVILKVNDACGQEQKKLIKINCKESSSESDVFFEIIPDMPTIPNTTSTPSIAQPNND